MNNNRPDNKYEQYYYREPQFGKRTLTFRFNLEDLEAVEPYPHDDEAELVPKRFGADT